MNSENQHFQVLADIITFVIQINANRSNNISFLFKIYQLTIILFSPKMCFNYVG